MHRRQHVVILRPDEHRILAHTMYYVDEIRDGPDISVASNSVSEKELRLAEAFINALAGPFRPENFRDEYRAGLESLIEGKMRADEGITRIPTRATTKTVDIMEALKASLEQVQAPKEPARRVGPKSSRVAKNRKRQGA
jgi:DNA end-binding protein Ku